VLKLAPSDPPSSSGDIRLFGRDVAIAGELVVVGATADQAAGFGDGAVYVFERSCGAAADLTITKSDGQSTATPGSAIEYTVTVTNLGPDDVVGAAVTDILPDDLVDCSWTCATAGGGSCTEGPVSGSIDELADLPSGAEATYTIQCTVDPGAVGSLANTATVTPPAGLSDPDLLNNSDADVDDLPAAGACGKAEDLVLENLTTSGAQVFEACNSIAAGPADVVAGSSTTFRAGVRIVLRGGFRVAAGGSFLATIDSGLASALANGPDEQ
jgi:uncharacterized repeat protein (TIGR01451 family)